MIMGIIRQNTKPELFPSLTNYHEKLCIENGEWFSLTFKIKAYNILSLQPLIFFLRILFPPSITAH